MPDSSTGDEYQSFGVINMANWSIAHFEILADYKIVVSFADGTSGIADLTPRLSRGALGDGLDPLCNKSDFAKAYLDYGALTWPGGIDLAPDAMYKQIRESGVSVLPARKKQAA